MGIVPITAKAVDMNKEGSMARNMRSITVAALAAGFVLTPGIGIASAMPGSDFKPLDIYSATCDSGSAQANGLAMAAGAYSLKEIRDGVPVDLGLRQQVKSRGDLVVINGPWQAPGTKLDLQLFRAGYDDTAGLVPVTDVVTSTRPTEAQCAAAGTPIIEDLNGVTPQ